MALVSLLEQPNVRTARILLHARRAEGAASYWDLDDGIVFSGGGGASVVDHRRAAGSDQPLATDAERYLLRSDQQVSMFDDLVVSAESQARRRVAMFLAPTGPGGRDLDEMRAILDAGERFLVAADEQEHKAPGFIPIVVGPRWRRALLDDLCELFETRGLPIALLFASPFDPLGTADDVLAALQLTTAVREGIVLRCDLSAFGLVAKGLEFGAVGATTDLRHVYLPMKRSRDRDREIDRSLHVYIAALRSWLRGSQLTYLDSNLELFNCYCRICSGGSVLRFAESGAEEDVLLRDEAEAHAALAWRGLVDSVFVGDRSTWTSRWLGECQAAEENFKILRGEGIALQQPGYLNAWISALS